MKNPYPRKTLAEKLLEILSENDELSISELARLTGQQRQNVVQKLWNLHRLGLVTERYAKQVTPHGWWIGVHLWKITEKGRRWLAGERQKFFSPSALTS